MKNRFFIATVILVLSITVFCCVGCEEEPAYTAEIDYVYSLEQTVMPFWYNVVGRETVIYNEIVVPIRYGGADEAVGYLAYEPSRIISVRDYTLEKEYAPDDYEINGNKITVKADGTMPYIAAEWLDGKTLPDEYASQITLTQYNDNGGTNDGAHVICEGNMTRTNHLAVTYAYDNKKQSLGFTPAAYSPERYANLLAKLEKGAPVKILVFGDSISVGASASQMMGFEPMQPTWFDLIKDELAARYYGGDETKITLDNPSVGGTTSEWGVEQINSGAFSVEGYDLVIIGFGMNDGFEGFNISARTFSSRIEKILQGIREKSPSADYVLLSCFTPNPKSVFAGNHGDYVDRLAQLAEKYNSESSGCTHVDMYSLSVYLLCAKQKNDTFDARYRYMDISANYTNHPNDYMIRLYAGSILATMIKF